jgi:hypothetical protein
LRYPFSAIKIGDFRYIVLSTYSQDTLGKIGNWIVALLPRTKEWAALENYVRAALDRQAVIC